MRRWIIGLLCVIASVTSRADQPSTKPTVPPYHCRWTEKPITIDGKADEEAWRDAVVIDDFRAWWKKGDEQKPHTTTKARLLWDREYLYFFAEVEDHDLYANTKEHQGNLWEGDVFELFFKPAADKPAYYEFEINPANATLELYFPSRDSGGWVKYAALTHIDLKTAVNARGTVNQPEDRDEGWSVEGRIPWRDMAQTGGRPKPGEEWLFTLCRVDTSGEKKPQYLSASAPLTKPSFHRYEDYATIKFEGPGERSSTDRPLGIEKRVAWTTSHVVGSPDGSMPYTVVKRFPNLKVFQPLYVLEEPGTHDSLLLQHLGSWSGPGRLLRFHNEPAVSETQTLLEIDGIAYGMTLHPDFLHNGYIYLMLNAPNTGSVKYDRIVRYTIDRQPPHLIDPASALVILEWESNGHNGGDVAFGPDGYLYHAAGDGTSDIDKNLRGQDLRYITSSMIRIDVDHPEPGKNYSVPKDNPFIDMHGARQEIWAYGFRNPWRFAFDRTNGNLWVGQNGQDLWEQVYLVHRGENYGWSVYEGSHPFNLNRKRGPTPIVMPTVEHPHSEMRSLTGGVVYHASKLPELRGAFIYGDWATGRIWGVKHDGKRVTWHKELARTTLQIVGFRETADGELWVIDQGSGIYRLEPTPASTQQPPFPMRLSETGLFASTADHRPVAGLIPYDVNSPLWSDGAAKERFIALPPDGVMEMTPTRGWQCPEGTVVVKTFSLPGDESRPGFLRRIETRIITKQLGQWAGYTYVWNDEQTDATLVGAAGLDWPYTIKQADGTSRVQTWHYPSRAECMTCHSRAMNFVLGLSTAQLNRDFHYGGGRVDNQLRVMEHLGVLKVDFVAHAREAARQELVEAGKSNSEIDAALGKTFESEGQRASEPSSLLPARPDAMPRLVNPSDVHADLSLRARSYLHANCAICHVEMGGGNALIDLEYTTPAARARLVDAEPQHERFGIEGARLIAPGDPAASVLLHRVSTRGTGRMPPLATSRVDEEAVALLRAWIAGMGGN